MIKEPNRNVYVGHRYVPLIMGEWDKQNDYEGLSIVTHQGASYTSKKRVPVGIDISNNEFWVVTGNYNAQVEYYRDETERVSEKLDSKSDQEYVDTELGKKSDITYVDTELGKKSDITYVDTELDKIDTELDTIDTELDKKVFKDELVINGKDYGVVGDGVTDDSDAIQYLVDNFENFYLPLGQYKIGKSILIPDGKNTQINGIVNNGLNRVAEEKTEFIVDGVDCFVAPEHDNVIHKVSISLTNISITGTGTEKGVSGTVGGFFEGCKFENLHTGIETSVGWVCRYHRNVFYRCTNGIDSKQTFSTSITENHFSYVDYAIKTGDNSVALYISRNTINMSLNAKTMMIVNGSVQIENNYFESFGANDPGAYCIHYTFNKWGHHALNIENNHMRGNNSTNNAIKIEADREDGNINYISGEIKNNNITQFIEKPIIFLENNRVYGLQIFNNGMEDTDLQLTNMPLKPIYSSSINGISSLNDTEHQPLELTTMYTNSEESNNSFIIPVSGLYEIDYSITILHTGVESNELENIYLEITSNGGRLDRNFGSVSGYGHKEGSLSYATINGKFVTNLNRASKIEIKARGNCYVRSGNFNIELLKNDYFQ